MKGGRKESKETQTEEGSDRITERKADLMVENE